MPRVEGTRNSGWLGPMEPARGESFASRDNVDVPPHSGMMRSQPLTINHLINLWYNFNNPETKTVIPRVDMAPNVWNPYPRRLIADWLGLMEPARGEDCRPGQHRGIVAPGDNKFPSPDQTSFHTSTTPTTRGQIRTSSGAIPPHKV